MSTAPCVQMEIPDALSEEAMEVVAQGLDADGETVDRALAIVRQFIADRGLVLYGGLGLDYSLRMRGSRIYPDGERPDYDALSPRNVDDAYELADILHDLGFPRARAIPALHIQTMRVQVDFTVVADLSFAPEAVVAAMPTLDFESEGSGPPVRVIHPYWQYMDQHLAFCFPFRDPPREPVFHRFRKDVVRFNLLHEKYPLPAPPLPEVRPRDAPVAVLVPLDPECALHGEAARHLLRRAASVVDGKLARDEMVGVVDGADGRRYLSVPAEEEARGFVACLATCSTDPKAVLTRLGYTFERRFRPLMDILPEVFVGAHGGEDIAEAEGAKSGRAAPRLFLFSLPGRLLSASLVAKTAGGAPIRMVSAQYLLMHYLMGYHACGGSSDLGGGELDCCLSTSVTGIGAGAYLRGYHDILKMVNFGAKRTKTLFEKKPKEANATPFSLTTSVLGDYNYGERQLLSIAKDAQSTKKEPKGIPPALVPPASEINRVPRGYDPARKNVKPEFDYALSPWFQWDGAPRA
jgi:hypothetical protein